jgi:HD-like signal output (HDOD) protein
MSGSKHGVGKRKGQQGYGEGRAQIAFDDDVLLDEEHMVEAVLACLKAPDYEPPTLPTVAVELMQLSQQPEVSFEEVVCLLERDSMLAGRVLQIVQSPLYSGAMKTESLHAALVRLGLRTLRDIVMEIAMNLKVFKSEDYAETMDLLREHSTATAHLARAVSKYTATEGEYAFLVGLLHDVGIAATLLALSHNAASPRTRRRPPDLIAIWPAVDRVHQQAAELMAEHWGLPHDIRLAIGAHHQVLIEGFPHPLAATVAIANQLAHDLGHGVVPKESTPLSTLSERERDCVSSHSEVDRCGKKTLEHARTALNLNDAQIKLIESDAAALLGELNQATD